VPRRRAAPEGLDDVTAAALDQWFSAAPLRLAVVDRKRRIRLVNPALAAATGIAAGEHAGRAVDEVLPALAAGLAPILARALDDGEAVSGEVVGGADGEGRWLVTCYPVRGDDGAVQAAALVLADPPRDGGDGDGDSDGARAASARAERLDIAMQGTGTGFWEWDVVADGVQWSASLGPMHGLEAGDAPSDFAGYLALVHAEDREALDAQVREALAGRHEYVHEFRVVHPDGREQWHASRGRVIRDEHGRPEAMVGLTADVTERRRRQDALTFLAEAGKALAGSLDPVLTMEEIARLAVPRLADWCAVQLAADFRGTYENIAVAHVDPDKVSWARALQDRYPPDPGAPTGAPEVIRTGRSELYPEIDEALLAATAQDDEHLEIIRQLQIHSAMVVPMRARDRTLGAITFIFAESGRQYSTHELELAEELGRRAGLALDHARLYDREHRTAETLQRALLPPTLSDIAGHEIAARYLPGRAGDHVGGDWYDAFALDGGRFGIAIGDIGGRGITAAGLMGQVRNALRAYAVKAPGPGATMADLRALDERLDELVFATLTYIDYDPRTGEAVMTSAGHLPALIVDPDGVAAFIDARTCPPLGAGGDAPCCEHRFTLAPGAALVLYTDGLVESRARSLEAGLDLLAQTAGASRGDVQQLAEDVIEAVPLEREDDIALLALRRNAT
jgi:PAS domain S-box-containing protein